MSESLTVTQSSGLAELERIIQENLPAYCIVGIALMKIKNDRLYEKQYGTFEKYCKSRWNFERAHAYRLIKSSVVFQNLSPIGDIPKAEGVIRPLTKIKDPVKQREIYEKAIKTAPKGRVTAQHIEKTIKEVKKPKEFAQETSLSTGVTCISPQYRISDARAFATMAISQLERIRADDPCREEEMKRVMTWIQNHIKGEKTKCQKRF